VKSISYKKFADRLLAPIVESTYLNRDMCKFESSQIDGSRLIPRMHTETLVLLRVDRRICILCQTSQRLVWKHEYDVQLWQRAHPKFKWPPHATDNTYSRYSRSAYWNEWLHNFNPSRRTKEFQCRVVSGN